MEEPPPPSSHSNATAAATEEDEEEDHDDADDNDTEYNFGSQVEGSDGKRRLQRSLPRVKAMLEDPAYLSGLLNALERSECYKHPIATLNNPWSTAFHNVYSTVASDCHLPQGKNRHHKFKDKILELWTAMEREIQDPTNPKSLQTHPLYALALRQLHEYRAATSLAERKRPTSTMGETLASASSLSPHVTDRSPATLSATNSRPLQATAHGGGLTPAVAAGMPPATKRTRVDRMAGWASASTLPALSTPLPSEALLLSRIHTSLQRIEAVACYSLGPPKLPSPLAELHRILMGGMLDDPHNRQLLLPYYHKCLAAFLRVAQEQADSATTPGLLPGVLEGLELLTRYEHADEDENIRKGLQYTYHYVLQAYLKLIEPQVTFHPRSSPDDASV